MNPRAVRFAQFNAAVNGIERVRFALGDALAGELGPDIAAWFAHQRRLAAGDVADALVHLAPGLRLVEVAEREPPGETQLACYVAPGAGSLHGARPVSRAAFALLIRAAASELRPREVDGDDARELGALLASGILHLRYPHSEASRP